MSFTCRLLKKLDFFRVAHLFQNAEENFSELLCKDTLPKKKRVLVTACQFFDMFQTAPMVFPEAIETIEKQNLIWVYSYYLASRLYASIHIPDLVVHAAYVYLDKEKQDVLSSSSSSSSVKSTKESCKEQLPILLRKLILLEKLAIPILANHIRQYGRSNIWELMNDTYKHNKMYVWPYILFMCLHTRVDTVDVVVHDAITLMNRVNACRHLSIYKNATDERHESAGWAVFWHNWNEMEIYAKEMTIVQNKHILDLLGKIEYHEEWKQVLKMFNQLFIMHKDDMFDILNGMISFSKKLCMISSTSI